MADFEEDLRKLETITGDIKRSDIKLEDALKDFEEGIKLAKRMEKEIDAMEAKIQVLLKEGEIPEDAAPASTASKKKSSKKEEGPSLDLFSVSSEVNGTRNA